MSECLLYVGGTDKAVRLWRIGKMSKVKVEEFIVEGRDYSRTVWLLAGPKGDTHRLCLFLDGDHYLKSVGARAILEDAVAGGLLPNMSFLFVAHESAAARHADFTCNDLYTRFVAEDLPRWARAKVSSIGREGNIVCGISLSGLASAYTALKYPQVFSASLCQSGSFWWNDLRFGDLVRQHSPIASRYWLSVGDEETEKDVSHPPTDMYQGVTQIEGVRSAVDQLKAGGATVRNHLYSGGHEFGPWADELCDALQWCCSPESQPIPPR